MDAKPWQRLRSALRGEAGTPPPTLAGVTGAGLRSWAAGRGLEVEAGPEGALATGTARLGRVAASWTGGAEPTDGVEPAGVTGLEVAVTASEPPPPPELAAFLLEPVARALREPARSALDTWARGQLQHRSPYNAATTVGGMQLAVAIDDGDVDGRTWTFTARPG